MLFVDGYEIPGSRMSRGTTIADNLSNLNGTSRVNNKLRRLTLDLCSIFAIYLAVDQEEMEAYGEAFSWYA